MCDIELTHSQQQAFDAFKTFLTDTETDVFILKGYAGTGKTTLMKSFIDEFHKRELRYNLLASTGRAAKILSNATGPETRTVHSRIYNFNGLNQNLEKIADEREKTKMDQSGQLYLNFGLSTVFQGDIDQDYRFYIVDEASMISDVKDNHISQALFGSGKLLSDLFLYDPHGKFIFVGDICQLPPVFQSFSPALSAEYIESTFGKKCKVMELTEIVRQASDVDIVRSAEKMRKLYYNPQDTTWAKFPMKGYRDIHVLNDQITLTRQYIERVNENGFEDATLICFSNKQCDTTTQLLRPSFGHHSPTLEKGDLLLITQNNLISGLLNGDIVIVQDIMSQELRAGLTFLKVAVKELFTNRVYSQLLIADVIYSNQTNLTQPQQKELFIDYYYRMKDKGIKQNSPSFRDHMMNDPYLNALRAVFGYALTCHKAQGGEWNYVYLDIPSSLAAKDKPYVYQWVYTAMTRAKKGLYIVDGFWLM